MFISVPFCVEGYGGAAQFTTAGEGQQGAAYGYFARAGDVFQVGDAAGDFIGKLYDALHQGFEIHFCFLLVCCFDVFTLRRQTTLSRTFLKYFRRNDKKKPPEGGFKLLCCFNKDL